MSEKNISVATFSPKTRSYWTLLWVFISFITVAGIILIPIVALLAYLISGKMIKATSAVLLERKLVVKRGVWFVVEKSIPLEQITDVALIQGPIMRIFGLYSLSFETAGQSGEGALVSIVGINEPEVFREAILAQKDNLKADVANVAESLSPEDSITTLTQSVKNIEAMLLTLIEKNK
jgi:putative membrane protein